MKRFCQSLKSTERITDAKFTTIEAKFKHAWARDKGMAPKVKAIFVIKHKRLSSVLLALVDASFHMGCHIIANPTMFRAQNEKLGLVPLLKEIIS